MGIGKICRLYNISYQVGLTEARLLSDSEVINDHGSLQHNSLFICY